MIDARTPAEFREVHADLAQNVPLDRLTPAAVNPADQPLYVICRIGGRGANERSASRNGRRQHRSRPPHPPHLRPNVPR